MNSQKVEEALKEIWNTYESEGMRKRTQVMAAVRDLLPERLYPEEHFVLQNAMGCDAFCLLLAAGSITDDMAERTAEQLVRVRRMRDEDAAFVVRCAIAARGGNPDLMRENRIQQEKAERVPIQSSVIDPKIREHYIGKSIFANYFRGMEAVGGKIYFDDVGFTFKSHAFNIQTGDTRIEYNQIQQVQKANTLGIVPNSIYVFTKDGTRHQFVIYNRNNVIKFLESRIVSI